MTTVREAVEQVIARKRVTLWLDWDIWQKERREEAINYMTGFVEEVLDVLEDSIHTSWEDVKNKRNNVD